jgi:hypothetical protein
MFFLLLCREPLHRGFFMFGRRQESMSLMLLRPCVSLA